MLVTSSLASVLSYAEPVAVRYPEGSLHGYLALRNLDGKLLASGELTQIVRGEQVTARLVYRFKDGSVDDDTAVFTQSGHFHLLREHHLQKGLAFPKPTDLTVDTKTGEVTVRYHEDGKLKVDRSHMDLPDDLANGILLDVVMSLSSETPETKISFLAATPKPRLVHLSLRPDGTDTFHSAGLQNTAQKYRVHVELGGLAGAIAPLIGKEPADGLIWMGTGKVPAFLKSEGPLYLGSALFRTELVQPVWN